MTPDEGTVKLLKRRVDQLEARVAALEKRFAGERCPKCGKLEYRVIAESPGETLGGLAMLTRVMECAECGQRDETKTPQGKKK